jgi:hypothetical protein
MKFYFIKPQLLITNWTLNIVLHDGSYSPYSQRNKFYENIPRLDYLKCYAGVYNRKIQDAIDCGILGYHRSFLATDKLKETLVAYHLPEHHFFSAKVLFRKVFYEYHLFHFSIDETDKFTIKEKCDFEFEYKPPLASCFKKLTFKKDIQNYDLFSMSEMLPSRAFISERLKDALIANNITGFDIQLADWVTFE